MAIVAINPIAIMSTDPAGGCSAGYNGFFCTERIKYNAYFIYKCMFIIGRFFNINWKDALLLVFTIFVAGLNILLK